MTRILKKIIDKFSNRKKIKCHGTTRRKVRDAIIEADEELAYEVVNTTERFSNILSNRGSYVDGETELIDIKKCRYTGLGRIYF